MCLNAQHVCLFAVARLVVGGTMYDYLVDFMTWAVRCKTGDSMGSPHTLPERPATPSNNTKQASNKHKVSPLLHDSFCM